MNALNIYFSPMILSFFTSCVLGVYVFSQNPRSELHRVFSLICMLLALWTFIDFTVQITRDVELKLFWAKLGFFWPLFYAVLFHFTLIYTKNLKKKMSEIAIVSAYSVSILLSLLEFFLLFQPNGKLVRLIWSWCYIVPSWFVFYRVEDVWVGLILVSTIVIQAVSFIRLKNRGMNKTQKYIFIGYLFSIISSSGLFGLSVLIDPQMASLVHFTTLLGNAIIYYGIWKHELFIINTAIAADNIVSTMTDGLLIVDMEYNIIKVNAAVMKLTGYRREELESRPLSKLWEDNLAYIRTLDTLSRDEKIVSMEARILTKEDSLLSVSLSASLLVNRNNDPLGAVFIIRNITSEKEMDDQLAHLQKLEAIGQLAGGIAHDFNNTLAAIILSAQEIIDNFGGENPELNELTEIITGSAYYGRDLTRKILAFSRKEHAKKEVIDIHTIIVRVITLLSHTIDKRITIKSDLRADISNILCRPLDIQSALLNIALNGCDAMQERGGRLFFKTYVREWDADVFPILKRQDKTLLYVAIEIVDNGVGMDDYVKKRIFDPFFTTKPVGKGTGLGLSSVFGIIQRHDGMIDVKSKVNFGTTFIVYLPLHDQEPREEYT
ncbi:MAG: PAS domain S-box protein [Spirochaetales bacterium]|nr:PAS domain S-box protein [Spirochaetales bacterium]